MNYTNLNIKSSNHTFKYIVEYSDKPGVQTIPIKYFCGPNGYYFYNQNMQNVLTKRNYWDEIDETEAISDETIPTSYNISTFDLYFPRFSVETYETKIKYAITINTWINGVYLYLGSYIIDRHDAIACENGIRKFLNTEYYDHISIDTIDPFYLVYGDEWAQFREKFCGENIDQGLQKNNSASNINITLTPIIYKDGTWIKLDGYDSSQSTILINTKKNSHLVAQMVFENNAGDPKFVCKMKFNPVYNDDFGTYLAETYQILWDDTYKIKYCFVIADKENTYKYIEHKFDTPIQNTEFLLEEFKFDNWDDYIDGYYASTFVMIEKNGVDVLIITSNKVFITQEIFKYLLDEEVKHINIDTIDMEINKFDVVNIITNKIVSMERPSDYKANIIKPVFVKVQEPDAIRLHKVVTENIVINLDAYKNKVSVFTLKIGDTNFYEIGRINSGIVFKVIGTNLPDSDGLYYILNEDGELVTSGNYSIIK